MKSLLGKLGVIFIGLAIFGSAEVWGSDWKSYGSNDYCLAYYDAQSITRSSILINIVKVWTRWDWTDKGVLAWEEGSGKKYENFSQSRILYEINCQEKKFRRLSETLYSDKMELIHSISSPSKWEYIVPESIIEALHKEVCK
jgi:hypothetical protein